MSNELIGKEIAGKYVIESLIRETELGDFYRGSNRVTGAPVTIKVLALFDKTDSLIEEVYQKVRSIAHTKNAGVIANQGLLSAVKNIAKKVSIPGKLKVEVIPFGLEERLENSLEISIFRMIQEILTNAIKHAEASEININLTQHDNSLNIIVEDNGNGFNPKKIDKKEGMGLTNIEKKVEQMGGVFTIDSTEKRGTSIIIDIPL